MEAGMFTSEVFQLNEGCTSTVHVGPLPYVGDTSAFPSSPSKLSCLRRASSHLLRSSRFLRPGLSNQLIRAGKAAAKRTYFYQKSCLLPHFFAAFRNFLDFLFKTATERWLSPQNCCALGLARSFTVEKQLQSSNFLTIFTAFVKNFLTFLALLCKFLHIAHASAQLIKTSQVPTWPAKFRRNP